MKEELKLQEQYKKEAILEHTEGVSNQDRESILMREIFMVNEDPDFNPERNKEIIERTIAKTKKIREQNKAEYEKQLEERTESVREYLKHLDSGGSKTLEEYFGRRHLAYLQARKVIQQLRPDKSIVLSSEPKRG